MPVFLGGQVIEEIRLTDEQLATYTKRTNKVIRLSLTQSEIKIATYVGQYRHHVTSQQGTERKQDGGQNSLDMSITGAITEYAVAKAMNLNFDLNCDFRKFGADLITQNGLTIDVKSCTRVGGDLNAVRWSSDPNKRCDVYILTELFNNAVGLVGWIDGETFLQESNLADFGNGAFYTYPRHALRQFNVNENRKITL